jgi:hypothetical protein
MATHPPLPEANNGHTKLRLPSLESVRLSNFSLYSQKPVIDVSFSDGAFCLAGANGLGKLPKHFGKNESLEFTSSLILSVEHD